MTSLVGFLNSKGDLLNYKVYTTCQVSITEISGTVLRNPKNHVFYDCSFRILISCQCPLMDTKRRRKGVLVVCTNCRRKKIKCDKDMPCNNCVRSGLTTTCQYPDGIKMKHIVMGSTQAEKIQQLQEQVLQLKRQLAGQNEPTANPVIQQTRSIIDLISDKFVMHSVNMKPSRVQVVTSFRPNFTTKCIVEFKARSTATDSWKPPPKNDDFCADDFPSPVERGDARIEDTLSALLVSNYYGILERLLYFQNELNALIFDSFIPCEVLHMVFNAYLRPSARGILFLSPKKLHEYQPLALILIIVDLVEILTKYEKVSPFSQAMGTRPFELSRIALDTLHFAKYRKKQTYFGIMSIVAIRLTMFHYGHFTNSGFTYHVEYSYFQIAVNMAMSMGLDRDLDKLRYFVVDKEENDETNFAKQISFDCLKRLWNNLVMVDIQFSLFGPNPTINLEFSHGLYADVMTTTRHQVPYHELIIDMLRKLNSRTSLRDFVTICHGVKVHCAQLISFGDVLHLASNKNTWPQVLNKLYSLKIVLELYSFAGYQSSPCGRMKVFSVEQLSDPKNIAELDKIHFRFKKYATMIYIFALKFIQEILNCNSQPMFQMYMRNLIWVFLVRPSVGIVNLSIAPGKHIKKGEVEIDLSLNELEHLLFGDNEIPSHIVDYYSSPHILEGEILKIFMNVIDTPMMLSNYDFYTNARFCLVLICFLKAYNQFTYHGDFHVLNAFKAIPGIMVGKYQEMIKTLFLKRGETPVMTANEMEFEKYHTPSSMEDPLTEYMSATFADIEMFREMVAIPIDSITDCSF